jgi:hypothetical protein
MKQFSNVLHEYSVWLTSFRIVNLVLPYHQYILFGGLVSSFFNYLLVHAFHYYISFFYTLGHYAFFAGIFLTLAAPVKKHLPYAMWGYVFFILFPFKSFSLYQVIEAVVYVYLGYAFFKYEASETLQPSG